MGDLRYRHLWFKEREQIAIWRLETVSQAEMARRLKSATNVMPVKSDRINARAFSKGDQDT